MVSGQINSAPTLDGNGALRSHHRALPTPPEEISPNPFQLYIFYRVPTFFVCILYFVSIIVVFVGGGVVLSWPKFFPLPSPRLILSRHKIIELTPPPLTGFRPLEIF